jgi:hypothetical protein
MPILSLSWFKFEKEIFQVSKFAQDYRLESLMIIAFLMVPEGSYAPS